MQRGRHPRPDWVEGQALDPSRLGLELGQHGLPSLTRLICFGGSVGGSPGQGAVWLKQINKNDCCAQACRGIKPLNPFARFLVPVKLEGKVLVPLTTTMTAPRCAEGPFSMRRSSHQQRPHPAAVMVLPQPLVPLSSHYHGGRARFLLLKPSVVFRTQTPALDTGIGMKILPLTLP